MIKKGKIFALTTLILLGSSMTVFAVQQTKSWSLEYSAIKGTVYSTVRNTGNATTTEISEKRKSSVKVSILAYNKTGVPDYTSRKYGPTRDKETTVQSYSNTDVKVWEAMHSTNNSSYNGYTQAVYQ
ncbi:hypothetical protein [uncultured Clostridium sp.]|uniref:hypothetical protein n=1 Tax=uncultured Clostridium sp. TaxID=59620 RepID=UPI00262D43EA|nr:hypothetical protein [uncultured Clostridium sp.]